MYTKQCTISWYVDNNKVSHAEEKFKTRIIERIYEYFGNLQCREEQSINSWGFK